MESSFEKEKSLDSLDTEDVIEIAPEQLDFLVRVVAAGFVKWALCGAAIGFLFFWRIYNFGGFEHFVVGIFFSLLFPLVLHITASILNS